MNPLKYILVPLGLLIALGFLLTNQYGEDWSWLIVLPILLLVPAYVFGPQIKWWYWQRYAPDMPRMAAPVLAMFPFYQQLDREEQREFRRRAFLVREAAQFIGKGINRVADDVQWMLAVAATVVNFRRKDFLPGDFETIVLYQHDFPSPQYPNDLHAVEVYQPEGTLIFNMKKLVHGTVEPQKYVHLGLWAYCHVYTKMYPEANFPVLSWADVSTISRFPSDQLSAYIGLPDLQTSELGMLLCFTHADIFKQQHPRIFEAYLKAFQA